MKHFLPLVLAMLVTGMAANRLAAQNKASFSFAVKKEGHGRPMILIPGLYSSGAVWDETVAHFKDRFECHMLTLPGFAGQPPLAQQDSILKTVEHQLAAYIRQNKLVKPVIVGHSLGGWVALAFGVDYPGLAGDIVSVSSAPFLPALSMGKGMSVDSASKMGLQIKQYMAVQTPDGIRQAQQYVLGTMMRDSIRKAQVTEMAVSSDPATQGEVMYELFSSDLRPRMGAVKSRILAVADWVAYKQYGATHESVNANLKEQLAGAAQVTIVINDESKHFIMFDEPVWLWEQMDKFLGM